jgi:hypothetical protein
MKRKLGENGKIFGTVTHKQIVEELKLKSGGKGTFHVFWFSSIFSEQCFAVDLSVKNKMDFPEIHGLGEYGVIFMPFALVSHINGNLKYFCVGKHPVAPGSDSSVEVEGGQRIKGSSRSSWAKSTIRDAEGMCIISIK